MSIGSTRTICQSERMKNAPLSSIRNIIAYSDKLEQEGRSIIHLELGEPDFGTPAHIIDACKKALDNQEVHYGPIAGTVELRKALSRHAPGMASSTRRKKSSYPPAWSTASSCPCSPIWTPVTKFWSPIPVI